MADDYAPAFPFKTDGGGLFPVVTGIARTNQEVTQAVLIRIHSMPMEKGLGSEFDRVLFMLEGATRDGLTRELAGSAVEAMVPGVVVTQASVETGNDGSEVQIDIGWESDEATGQVTVPYRRT